MRRCHPAATVHPTVHSWDFANWHVLLVHCNTQCAKANNVHFISFSISIARGRETVQQTLKYLRYYWHPSQSHLVDPRTGQHVSRSSQIWDITRGLFTVGRGTHAALLGSSLEGVNISAVHRLGVFITDQSRVWTVWAPPGVQLLITKGRSHPPRLPGVITTIVLIK